MTVPQKNFFKTKLFPIILFVFYFIISSSLFFRSLDNYFVADDFIILLTVSKNTLLSIFSHMNFHFTPIPIFFYKIIYNIWDLNPIPYKIFLIFINSLNCVLVFSISKNLFSIFPHKDNNENTIIYKSLLSSFIFCLMFSHTETIIYFSCHHEILFTFFYLCALNIYLYGKQYPDKQKIILIIIFFICSLLSKENAVSFFILVLVLEIFIFHNKLLIVLKSYFSLIIVSGSYFLLRILLKTQISGLEMSNRFTGIISETVKNIIFSFTAFIFSLNFIAIKEIYKGHNINYTDTLVSLLKYYPFSVILIIFSIFLFVLLFIKRNKIINFGFLFISLTILPFVWLTGYERYLYLPSFGFALILTESLYYFYKKKNAYKMIVMLILSVFIVYNVYNIQEREYNWKKASDICKNAIEEIQKLSADFPPNSKVYFRDLPDNYNGAWIFRDGIQYVPDVILKRNDLFFSRVFEEDTVRTNLNNNIYIFDYYNGKLTLEK